MAVDFGRDGRDVHPGLTSIFISNSTKEASDCGKQQGPAALLDDGGPVTFCHRAGK
jgi:hypothetical protein